MSITYVYTYYDNPQMLQIQYQQWSSYPEHPREKVSVVLVDDASPKTPAADVARPRRLPKLSIYRVQIDVPWHQDGARNLGAFKADEGWLFCSDIDHAMPAKSLEILLSTLPRYEHRRDGTFFVFPRLDAPEMKLVEKGPGANIFAITRRAYWERMQGYDEDMCGQYGSDGDPRRRLLRSGSRKVVLESCPVVRYNEDVVADANTTTWERRGPEQDKRRQSVVAKKRALGREGKITHLDFEWSRAL